MHTDETIEEIELAEKERIALEEYHLSLLESEPEYETNHGYNK